MEDTLILIPARSGSTRVKDKNKREIGGIPLVAHIIKTALRSECGRVVVSTDCEEIQNISLSFGAEVPFLRPNEFSNSTASSLTPILHAIKWFKEHENWIPSYIMFTPPTSLFTSVKTLRDSKKSILESEKDINSSVTVSHPNTHPFSIVTVDSTTQRVNNENIIVNGLSSKGLVRSQDYPTVYEVCGCCTTTKTSFFIKLLEDVNWNISEVKNKLVLDKYNCIHTLVPSLEASDINTMEDFDFVKKLYELNNKIIQYSPFMKVNSKITLRKLKESDLKDIYEYSSNKEFTKYLSFTNTPTIEDTKLFIKNINSDILNGKRLYWGIEIDKKIVGTIGFLNIKNDLHEAELGFGISPDYWGKGIINQCMSFLIHLSFMKINFNKLIVGTNNENVRTIEFSKKEGFILDYKTKTHTYLYLDKNSYNQKFYNYH